MSGKRTIARLTPAGRGAVAVMRLLGDDAAERIAPLLFHADGRPFSIEELTAATRRPLFARFTLDFDSDAESGVSDNSDASGDSPCEEVVLRVVDAAHLEIHAHGGEGIVAAIFRTCVRRGFEPEDPLAPVAGESFAATAERLLPGALTERGTLCLLDQHNGAAERFFRRIFTRLEESSADGEARRRAVADAERIAAFAQLGAHLTEPFRVVLAGPVNSGKSTLFNALLGYDRAIADAEAGTTRDAICAETAFDSVPVRLFDTAGLRETDDRIEREGIERAEALLAEADLILSLRDASAPQSERLSQTSIERVAGGGVPILTIRTKWDLLSPEERAQEDALKTGEERQERPTRVESGRLIDGDRSPLPLSVKEPETVRRLERLIAATLVPEWPSVGEPVPLDGAQTELYRGFAERLLSGNPLSEAEKTAIIRKVAGEGDFPSPIGPHSSIG